MSLFWNNLPKPFFVLAPLANVTDAAFRRVIAKYSKPTGPHVMWTEFVSADGLFKGRRDVLMKDLLYSEAERPIVAQFFTSSPEMMKKAASLALKLNFDGVDINMGCPDRSVEKQGAGAALCKNPKLAREIIKSAKEGVSEKIPVSVKIRLGYNKDELESWLPEILKESPAAVSIHLRTRKEMSKVPAHWERVRRAVEIRNVMKSRTLIVGNGDALDLKNAREKALEFGCDGVMLGRAIFGKPWLFSNSEKFADRENPKVIRKILEILIEHTKLFEELLPHKDFSIMKKHFKAYISDWSGAKDLRMALMETQNTDKVKEVLGKYLKCQK
jgi:nifR3 family TIM-barrel protein